jgi:hypothetical protein
MDGILNHADSVYQQRQFWAKIANDYANVDNLDVDYLAKVINTAALWEQRWQDYLAHVKVNNTSFHLSIN